MKVRSATVFSFVAPESTLCLCWPTDQFRLARVCEIISSKETFTKIIWQMSGTTGLRNTVIEAGPKPANALPAIYTSIAKAMVCISGMKKPENCYFAIYTVLKKPSSNPLDMT